MVRFRNGWGRCLSYAFLGLPILSLHARGQSALKALDSQSGGHILYGTLPAQSSVKREMGAVLNRLHTQFGDRPQLGRLFGDRNDDSAAVFFTLTAKPGGQRIAGLVVVSVAEGGAGAVALLYDEMQRFPDTVNPMLRRLQVASEPARPRMRAVAVSNQRVTVPLHHTLFGDGSGSMALPAGWRLDTAQGGAVLAKGPAGERLLFGSYIPIAGGANPPRQRLLAAQNIERSETPAAHVTMAHNWDAGRSLIQAEAQLAREQRLSAPAITVGEVRESNCSFPGRLFILQGNEDVHDGKGSMAMTAQVFMSPPRNAQGDWSMTIYQAIVPRALAARERATIAAIARSFTRSNESMPGEVHQQIKMSSDFISALLSRASQTDASARAASDGQGRQSDVFLSLQLDAAVIGEANRSGLDAFANDFASALVEFNPERFQYLPRDFLKGVEY